MGVLIQSPKALGRALRDARRRKGLTQQALARLAHIGQPSVSNIERGISSVSLTTLLRILAALELELWAQERPDTALLPKWDEGG